MKLLLECINCEKYQWELCGGVKVVAVFPGLQQGYMNHKNIVNTTCLIKQVVFDYIL